MASQLLGIKTRFTNDLGSPLVGGQVYTYFAGTSTNQDTYSDAAMTVPNTNPVILDDTGSADIFLKGAYRIRVFDKSGRFIEEQDNVTQAASQGDATELSNKVTTLEGGLSTANTELSKVKLDTGITVTPSATGRLPRDLHSKLSDTVSVNDYGDFAANPKVVLQKAIDNVSLAGGGEISVPAGVFDFSSGGIVLKENVHINCAGEGVTVFDQGAFAGDLVSTPVVAEKPLTMTTDLNEGDISHTIDNTCDVGDFIKFSSDKLFTDRWSTREIRPYYLEGELFEVAKKTAAMVGFSKAGFAICKLADAAKAITFKPTKNMSIKNLTLRKSSNVINTSRGLVVSQAKGFSYANITTENYDNAGIAVQRSIGTTAGTVKHIGGSSTLGLCYGTLYSDGAKDSYAAEISGDGCRHTVAGGGTGWAISSHNTVANIKAVNSKNGALDTHGNTAYFHYKSAQIDNIGGMSGLGHTLTDVIAMGGDESVVDNGLSNYEGGRDITYRNIVGFNHGRWADAQATINCTYENITLEADKFTSIAKSPSMVGTKNNSFKNIRLVCKKAANATSNADADACHTTGSMFHVGTLLKNNSKLDGLYVEGFPFVIIGHEKNISVKNIEAVNCGWRTSLASNIGVIDIKEADGFTADGINIENTNTNLTYINYALRIYTSNAEHKNIQLENISNARTVDACKPYNAVYKDTKLINPVLINVNIKSTVLGVWDATNGTYINQNLTTDTYVKA